MPHDVLDCPEYTSHAPAAVQQPLGQEPLLQPQLPLVVSQTPFAQGAHAAPAEPHWEDDCEAKGTHVVPLQHPSGHDAASQTQLPAALQPWPVAQGEQLAPAVPQEEANSEAHGWHAPAEVQHPFGHDVASHTQLPAELHSWPVGHALHVVPPAPHEVADSPENGSQVLPAVQQPAQAEPPHVHAPPEHVPPLEHEPHAAPPVPHWDDDWPDGAMHCPPALQHPPGHDAALHTHCPAVSHVWPAPQAAHVAPPVPHAAADCTLKSSHCPLALQQPWRQLPCVHCKASPLGPSFAEASWAASLPGDIESPPPSESTVPSGPPPSPVLASASSCGVPIPASWVHARPDSASRTTTESAMTARSASGETRLIRRPPSRRSRFQRSRRPRALRSPSSTTHPTAP